MTATVELELTRPGHGAEIMSRGRLLLLRLLLFQSGNTRLESTVLRHQLLLPQREPEAN